MCSFDLFIKHGGYDDVSKHVKLARHIAKEGCLKHTIHVFKFSDNPSSSGYKCPDLSVILYNGRNFFAHFLVEHNIPISAADHAEELSKDVPREWQSSCTCGHTKVTAVVKEGACDHMTNLADAMRNGPFVLGTDRSQEGEEKWSLTIYLVFYQIIVKIKGRTGKVVLLFVDEHFKWKRPL